MSDDTKDARTQKATANSNIDGTKAGRAATRVTDRPGPRLQRHIGVQPARS